MPQTECLQIIYEEMFKKRHPLLVDTNLIIQLLQTNINYNYFSFTTFFLQQIYGTAMGATFSPTIANIFMSVTLSKFLRIQSTQPILLARYYIDDIFILWPERETVDVFLSELNSFHPNLKFTSSQSESEINFLEGYQFPLQIVHTNLRPDIVWWNSRERSVCFAELTLCFKSNFSEAAQWKTAKYTDLVHQAKCNGYNTVLLTLKVGSRGAPKLSSFIQLAHTLRMPKCDLHLLLRHCLQIYNHW